MTKKITVSAIIYNGKYDDLNNNESHFEELTTLDFDEWLKKHNEKRIEDGFAPDDSDEFDVHEETFEIA